MTANTIQFSGTIPASYDQYLGPVLFEPFAIDLALRLEARPGKRILELACGTGRLTAHLVSLAGYDQVTATDVNPDMLAYAARKIGSNPRLAWHRVDGVDLPYLDASFDTVICQFGWMFFSDKVQAVKEARRVLKPGGKLIFNVWNSLEENPWSRLADRLLQDYFPENPPAFFKTPFGYFDPEMIRRDLAEGGFSEFSLESLRFNGNPGQGELLAQGLVYGTPVSNELAGRNPEQFQAFYQQMLREQKRLFDSGERPATLQAWVVTAEKA